MCEAQGFLDLLMDSNVNLKVNVTRDTGANKCFTARITWKLCILTLESLTKYLLLGILNRGKNCLN